MFQLHYARGALCSAALTALLLTGCGDDSTSNNKQNNNADPCAGVVCDRGVCDPDTRACANPDACTQDAACLAGSICLSGACVDDPCTTDQGSPTCARGTCERGTGICQNAQSCTPDTAGVRCLEGFVCFDLACKSADDVCADLNCEARRGVCDPVAQACVAAADCAGDDQKCLAGAYCAPDNTCKPNACDVAMKTCARGVCDAASAECVDAPTCDDNTDCLDGNLCLAGACRPAATACGAAGCPGTQTCQHNAQTLTAACVEDAQAGCSNAIDCVEDRICVAGQCAPAAACDADKHEPNNDVASATDLAAEDGLTNGTLCPSDIDVYTLKVELPQGQLSSQLVWDLTIARADLGLGVVKAELRNPQGSVVATAESRANGAPAASLQLSYEINATRQGDYTLTLSGEQVLTAGLRYNLRADLVTQETLAACQMARPLSVNQLATGDLSQQASQGLVSSCGDDTFGAKPEHVWTFTLDAPKYVEIEGRPTGDLDLALSLRADCLRAATELDNGCREAAGPGADETLALRLDAGTYALVVEAKGGTPGPYALIFTAQDAVCSTESTCSSATERRYCAPTGTGFLTENCANGCDMATGRCDGLVGDSCAEPIVVDPATGYTGTLPIRSFTSKLDPGAGSCIPDSSPSSAVADSTTESDGSDVIFQVTVPPGQTVSAAFTRGSQYISAYILTTCGDVASCVAGANQSYATNESIFYANETGAPQTYFIVVDSSKDVSSTTSITANIQVRTFSCTPGERRCVRNRESQVCAADGSGYTTSTPCPYGCDVATGECSAFAYDTCGGAVTLVPGVPRNEDLSVFTADDAPTSPCSTTAPGLDAVYKLVGVPPNSNVRVQMNSSFDAVLWAANTCDVAAQKVRGCFQRVDGALSNGTETLDFFTAAGGDFFIVADTYSSSVVAGTFSIVADILPPACVPGVPLACADANALQSCDSNGKIVNVPCNGGCMNDAQGIGACGLPGGDLCGDAIPLVGASGTATRNLNEAVRTNALTLPAGRVDRCYLDETADDTKGRDTFYSVALQAGELLTVTLSSTSATTMLHLSEDCTSPASCIGYYNARPSSASAASPNVQTIRYQAPVAQTIFVVVDSQTLSTTTLDYTLSWQVTQGAACAPNTARCLDAATLERCNAQGVPSTLACADGCQGDACLPSPAADLCDTAPLLQPGTYIVQDLINAASEVNLATTDCIGATTAGNDVFYRIDAQAGQLVSARLTSYGEETYGLALITDCADAASSCLGGQRTLSTNASPYTAEVFYLADQAQTIYVMIDATSSSATSQDEGVGLLVDVQSPNCVPGQSSVCLDADTIQYCDARGLLANFECGARGCTDGLCNQPTADTCLDPVLLTGGSGTINGTWSNKTALVNPGEGRRAACVFDDADDPSGRDAIYAIDLQPGDLLNAELTSVGTLTATSWLYVLENCQAPSGSCAANHSTSGAGNRKISYAATTARRVFLVADTESTSTTESFTMVWSVTPGRVCAPNKWSCLDAATAVRCDATGLAHEVTVPCEDGCVNGACVLDIPAADVCGGVAIQRNAAPINSVTGGFYGFFNLRGRVDDLNVPINACGNTSATPGREGFITIALEPNETLTVRGTNYGGEVVTLQLFEDCAGAACVLGAQGAATLGTVTTLRYQAGATAETLYLAVDSSSSATDEPIGVEIVVRAPDCTPGVTPQVCNAISSGFIYCNEQGFSTPYECDGACMNGVCATPRADTCIDPERINTSAMMSGMFSVSGTLVDYADDLDLRAGNTCLALGSPTNGSDAVYRVELAAGQTMTASVVSDAAMPEDLTLYALDAAQGCPTSVSACLTGADNLDASNMAETLTYTAQSAQTIYLVVDSYFAASAGDFTLNVAIQ